MVWGLVWSLFSADQAQVNTDRAVNVHFGQKRVPLASGLDARAVTKCPYV